MDLKLTLEQSLQLQIIQNELKECQDVEILKEFILDLQRQNYALRNAFVSVVKSIDVPSPDDMKQLLESKLEINN